MIDGTNPRILADNIRDIEKQTGGLDSRVAALEVTAPKDYSTTETATGQKWIDGRDVYCKVISDNIPAIETATNVTILTDTDIDNIIKYDFVVNSSNTENLRLASTVVHNKTTGTIIVYSVPQVYSEEPYKSIIYYVKKPTPGDAQGPEDSDQEPEHEPEEKKTTKKKSSK